MGIILHNEQLKFGKYQMLALPQVRQKDSSYANWPIGNVTENVFVLCDINYWTLTEQIFFYLKQEIGDFDIIF